MTGMDRQTGRSIGERAHLAQSVRDILTTLKGSRVMRRDYGSDLPRLVDQNIDGRTIARFYAATADALNKWEPRLRVTRVQMVSGKAEIENGHVIIALEGEYLPDGKPIRLEGLVLS